MRTAWMCLAQYRLEELLRSLLPPKEVSRLLAAVHLMEVLSAFVPGLETNRRNLSKRVRVVMDWIAGVVNTHLQAF